MACWVEDRWWITETSDDGATTTKKKSPRYEVGLRYRVRYETADGAERSKSFEKKKDADSFRDRVAADLRRGTYLDTEAGKVSLRKFAQGWLDSQTFDDVSREATVWRVSHIVAGLGDKRLDQLSSSPSTVQAWLRGLKLAPNTARQCFTTLSCICNAAVEDGRMQRNPCRATSIRLPQPDRRKIVPLEAPTLEALRAAIGPRYAAMLNAGAGCGLRQSEIFALSPDDIEFLRQSVSVQRQVKIVAGRLYFALPKRLKTRDVPLAPGDALAFSAHLARFPAFPVTLPWHQPGFPRHGKPETVRLMFTSPLAHKALSRQRFNTNEWKPALLRAKIPVTRENGMHVLRHTYASMLLSNGADVNQVAECLGHDDPGFTLRVYGHTMSGAADQVRRIIDSARAVPSPAPVKIVSDS